MTYTEECIGHFLKGGNEMGPELVVLAAFVKKAVDFVRNLRGRDVSAILTQLFAWLAGVVVVWLAAHVDFASAIEIANIQLDQMGLWTQAALGVLLGSGASIFQDGLKAIDNTQSEAKPKLVP
jgi:ABC-type amino acid transport system permease subunit